MDQIEITPVTKPLSAEVTALGEVQIRATF
jgi:hypothetical protein